MNLIDFYVLILIVYSKSLMLWEIYLFHICIAVLLCDAEVEHSVL